jgi:putative flippase GtrA
MRRETIKQFFKFLIIGVLNTLINLSVLYLCTDILKIYYMISAVIAFLFAVTNSFILNKIWTFEEKLSYNPVEKYIKFFTISLIALSINLGILYSLTEFLHIHYLFSQLIAVGANFIINFFGNRLWTFKEKEYNSY